MGFSYAAPLFLGLCQAELPAIRPTGEHVPPLSEQDSLPGGNAVVTGASSGIGRAVAHRLAQAGVNVFLHANHSFGPLETLRAQAAAEGVQSATHLADLADPAECEGLVGAALAWRPIDIWVHAAGADVLTGDAAGWTFQQKLDHLFAVDLRGTMLCCRAIGQSMAQRGGGSIVTIGWDQSALGMEGDSGQLFAAVKGGIAAFTRSLAKSLAPTVRVNCVAPGWIKTRWGESAPQAWSSRAQRESLKGRWGTPEDVASAVLFLTSADADFVNGQVLEVNGGFAGGTSLRE